MKILYGVQGTGNGHISRARMMAKYFTEAAKTKTLEVTFLFTGRPEDQFFDMECFGDYLHREGLSFVSLGGEVHYGKTLYANKHIKFIRDVLRLDLSSYDLIVSDFEPVTAWAAKLQGKKVLGIGHQYAFAYDIPLAGASFLSQLIMRYFAPSSINIGLHWHHFGKTILPPIIDTELKARPTDGHVLVYLPFEDQEKVSALLRCFPNQKFIQYSPELSNRTAGNIELRQPSHSGFKRDLSAAKSVICNTGFELISECLQLNLPILTNPLRGQMEQLSNAEALQQLGYATTLNMLDRNAIAQWLALAEKPPSITFPNVAKALVNWLIQGDLDNPEQLCQQLWNDFNISHAQNEAPVISLG